MSFIQSINSNSRPYTQFSAVNEKSLNKQTQFHIQYENVQKPKQADSDFAVNISRSHADASKFATFYYEKIKGHANSVVDDSLPADKYSKGLHHETLSQIMKMPIDVEVERHEMQQALLFNSLGIDFLAYKELGVRREMLALAEDDIMGDDRLADYEKARFVDAIRGFDARLEEAQNALLGGVPSDALDADMNDPSNPWSILAKAAA
ncbi:hypothetical protein [Pseudoalteromonas aurantia]|uniref:Uncharacterized protein n=1 Tax=Pseudoalteromonas aurantia 208 TaxID=1314867 RepID=A0ABR9EK36_9GAMM|nr:hypothetical protein [Pseudoalteromonas aurantia]MBE0370789.1 hypothetical protein [Pseudoalteromonas aurantia 208]